MTSAEKAFFFLNVNRDIGLSSCSRVKKRGITKTPEPVLTDKW
jgi:hypothetical protein